MSHPIQLTIPLVRTSISRSPLWRAGRKMVALGGLLAVMLVSTSLLGPVTAKGELGENKPLWLNRYNGSANTLDIAQAVAVSPDGKRVFVTGLSDGLGPSYYTTVAHDAATGHKLWTHLYNGSKCTDSAVAVAVSPDGTKVFVTGSSGCLGLEDYATVAYDAATGIELWAHRYDGPTQDPDEAFALAVSPDGTKVFVTGRSFGVFSEGRDYATVAYAAVTGRELWVSRYDGPAHGEERSNDEAYGVVVSPDGKKVFVTGTSGGIGSASDYTTVAYNAGTGNELWVHRYNGPANAEDFAQALAVSPDGTKVFVTGYSYGVGTFSDYTTLACNAATGQELWLRRYDDPTHGFDFAYALALNPDGTKLFVTGSSDETGAGSNFVTLAYDAATGGKLWLRRYNGPGNDTDSASAIAVSPDGTRVFVTGVSAGIASSDFPFDYATVAYNTSSGRGLWLGRHNGPANQSDVPYDLAVSPDGTKVFVTGSSDGINSDTDYLTLAYPAVAGGP